jgi:hypothetical protein
MKRKLYDAPVAEAVDLFPYEEICNNLSGGVSSTAGDSVSDNDVEDGGSF